MEYRDLTAEDEELMAAAFEALDRGYREGHHHVGAAVRAGSGGIYTGVHMESPGVDVCAEWVAMGAAATAGQRKFTCIVAVRKSGPERKTPGVMSPCGVCRELLFSYGSEMDVIVPDEDGRVRKVRIRELLPIPYTDYRPITT